MGFIWTSAARIQWIRCNFFLGNWLNLDYKNILVQYRFYFENTNSKENRRMMEPKSLEEIGAFDITPISMKIQWKKVPLPSSSSYEIKYRKSGVQTKFNRLEIDNDKNEVHIKDLIPDTNYEIYVCEQKEDLSTIKHYELKVTTKESKAKDLMRLAEIKEESSGMQVYKMKIIKEKDIGEKVKELSFVKDESETLKLQHQVKNILLLGCTGAGKSTMVDALFNHFACVQYFDRIRYKISCEVPADKKGNEAKSQTDNVTCYTLPNVENLSTKCTFNIIDTPGFNDTDDNNIQRKIVKQVKALLEGPISSLHAVCIVMPMSSFRLTDAQKGVIDGIKGLFAKNVKDIIYCLATFNDGGDRHVLKALHDSKINIRSMFTFSNAGLFNEPNDEGLPKWNANRDNFEEFLTMIYQTHGESVEKTAKVLGATENIEMALEAMQSELRKLAQDVLNVQKETEIIEKQKGKLGLDKHFEYTITVPCNAKKRISNDEKNFNCQKCEKTCHKSCWVYFRFTYWTCEAIQSGKCTICPGRCPPSDHEKESAVYEYEYKTIKQTNEDLRKKYQDLGMAKSSLKDNIRTVDSLIQDVKTNLSELKKHSLAVQRYSAEEYMNILIKLEDDKQPGFMDRIEFYRLITENINYQDPVRRALKHLFSKNNQ